MTSNLAAVGVEPETDRIGPVVVRAPSVATVTSPPVPGANLPKFRSTECVIAIGTITVALELVVALAAKLLDAPKAPSATAEASAARRKALLKKIDEFMVIPCKYAAGL